MRWFAASIVLYVKYKDNKQNNYPIWENIYLISAMTPNEAYRKAISLGKNQQGDSNGTLKWCKRPACWKYAGVRKIIECTERNNKPTDGTEISYAQMLIKNRNDLKKLIKCKPVEVIYEE